MAKFIVKKEALKMNKVIDWVMMLLIYGVITVLINTLSYDFGLVESIPGILSLLGITLLGLFMAAILPFNIPAILYISLIGLIASLPMCGALSDFLYTSTSKISTLALCTVILAYSGVAIGKSWNEFKKMGWKGILITFFVILGTYVGSAIVAEMVLSAQGII